MILLMIMGLITGCSEDSEMDYVEAPAGTVYFKVSEMSVEHGDSFILPLTDETAIAHAREIIASDETEGKLILAKVVAATGSEAIKNLDLNTNKVWSWKVSEFIDFVDFTIEIYDGGPSDVEDMDFWFPNTNNGSTSSGIIGFWNYTIEAEVSPNDLQ